jgi:hypothetical protein
MLAALVFVLALAVPTYGPVPVPSESPPVPGARIPTGPDEALIVNSGSTNRAGYRLRVYADGTTALQQGDVSLRKRVSLTLVQRFFGDLRAAGALDALPRGSCMKSTSFGSSTYVGYRGTMSPDVSCPSGSTAARALAVDADALAAAAGVSLLVRPVPSP